MWWTRDWFLEMIGQPSTALLLDIAVKGTVLVLLALFVLRLMPRSSAALRHWLLCLTFCGLIVLPALCYFLPAWAIPILPEWKPDQAAVAAANDSTAVGDAHQAALANVDPVADRPLDKRPAAMGDPQVNAAMARPLDEQQPEIESVANHDPSAAATAAPVVAIDQPTKARFVSAWWIWSAGAALAFLPLLAGMARGMLMRAKALQIKDISWTVLRDQLCSRLSLKRAVRLLEVHSPIIPLSCGIVRPAVILPRDASRWNEHLRRFVLLHELAHVKRHDVLFQLIARLACAMYWFHPLVWYAMHRLRIERELACDDAVLAAGERASDYAEQLLEVARRLRPLRLHAAVAMAQSNKLEHRVSSLFSRARSHLPLSTWTSRLLLACAAVIVLTVSVVRPAPRKNEPAEREKAAQSDERKKADSAISSGDPAATDKSGKATVRGQIVGQDRRPAARAHVAVVARRKQVSLDDEQKPDTAVLAEAAADDQGRYQLSLDNPVANSYSYAYLIARGENTAVAWQRLNLDAATADVSLELKPTEPIAGRLVDLEGQPASGVRLSVRSVMSTLLGFANPLGGVGFSESPSTVAWPAAVETDRQGRFSIAGVPVGHGVFLTVEGNDRFAPQEIALNTGMSEQRGERDGTYRPQVVKNAKPGEDVILPLAPAQTFTGRVTYEDSGEPAADARLSIWASQQEYGSMISVRGRADADGRYRLNPYPGIRFGVTAFPPKGAPYVARRVEQITWDSGARTNEINIKLARMPLIIGQVLEEGTGRPVAKASVQYHPEEANNPNVRDDFLTGWQAIETTDEQGRFRIVVLPGRGRLLVHGPDDKYVLRETSSHELYYGRTGGERYYAHGISPIDPKNDSAPLDVTVRLQPGGMARGELVDEQGQAIDAALMATRLTIRPYGLHWSGQPREILGGRIELGGLAANEEYPVHFVDPKRRLGATVMLKAGSEPTRVVLVRCGRATMRFVDDKGKGIAGHRPIVKLVVTPGPFRWNPSPPEEKTLAADEDFIANVDRQNHGELKADAEGRVTLPALIPGANYRVTTVQNEKLVVAKEFQAKSGETIDLGDIVYERGDK